MRFIISLAKLLVLAAGGLSMPVHSFDWFVTNTNDSGEGSLRMAIMNANGTMEQLDGIHFNIEGSPPHLIALASELPAILYPVVIDGYTDPHASENTLEEGTSAVLAVGISGGNSIENGLRLESATGGVTVRGLVIIDFLDAGITIASGSNNVVSGNYMGVEFDGSTEARNHWGVEVLTSDNVVGGSDPADRNVISGVVGVGLFAGGNSVLGNHIGVSADGTSIIPQDPTFEIGVQIGSRNIAANGTIVGSPGDANTIGGAYGAGVGVINDNNATVSANRLGAVSSLANMRGIVICPWASNAIIGGTQAGEGNTVAHSLREGVHIIGASSFGHSIRRNNIHHNGRLGIDLEDGSECFAGHGVTENDEDDPDENGANALQNFPFLTDATRSKSDIQVSGVLNSLPSQNFVLEFFGNTEMEPADDAGHHHGEGEFYLGSENVMTSASGDVNFNATLDPGEGWCVSATATHIETGNTSEFSPCFPIVADICTVTNTDNSGAGSFRGAVDDCANNPANGTVNLVNIELTKEDTITLMDPPPTVEGPLMVSGTVGGIAGSSGMIGTIALDSYAFLENINVTGPVLGAGILVNGGHNVINGGAISGVPPVLLGFAGLVDFNTIQNAQLNTTEFSSLQLAGNHTLVLSVDANGSFIVEGTNNLVADSTVNALGQNFGMLMPLGPDDNQSLSTTYSNTTTPLDIGPVGHHIQVPGHADNYPVFESSPKRTAVARGPATATRVKGMLDSTPNSRFTIEVFVNTSGCAKESFGAADAFLGAFEVDTGDDGIASFDEVIDSPTSPGDFILGTASEPFGNTSEFSFCVPAEQASPSVFEDGFENT